MILRFLNCGQGDSIVLEWREDNETHIGLIDSNKIKGFNPSLEYLKSLKLKKIDFIILSHPHEDHFSGLYDILEYCESNKIQIGIFYHTCYQIPAYLKMCVKTNHAAGLLAKTIKKVFDLRDIKLIGYIYDAKIETKELILSNNTNLDFLSPTDVENRKYNNRVPLYHDDENADCMPEANWLCTMIRVKDLINKWVLLLTSDVPSEVFKRVRKENQFLEKLVLAQCPHHGAKKNLNKMFWKKLFIEKGTPMVISVGDNIYGHPSGDVITYFDSIGFSIYRTDCYSHNYNQISESELFMDLLSSKIISAEGNHAFEITGKSITHL